ncbi:MAG: trypsin-like peptidase domain-containing protein, partial [Nocardioides sp.]|nr:trypsin-like peptidase domain-containing protein [Nocardioides sp.]
QISTSGLDLQDLVSVQTVADKSLPSVVKIEGARAEGSGSGSGVVISEDGLILTNYHVAWLGEDGGQLEILFDDGTSAGAEIQGVDPSMDIAVIRAEDVSGLTPMPFGQAEDVKVGQAVVAVGSPYGLASTVTAGIISSINRPVEVPGMGDSGAPMVYPGLQTDAAINPGNSGGALVNIKGELVGMNSANKLAQSAEGTSGDLGSIGIGWAIPINVIKPIVEQLKEGQSPVHAWLGVNPDDAKEKGLARGAEVTGFLDGGNAEEAGVEEGDIITAIDDYPISNGLGLITTALQFEPGDKVNLHVVRDGEEQEIEVEMGEKGDLFED